MARALTEEVQHEFLNEHIPYRLVAVEGLNWFVEKLLAGQQLSSLSLAVGSRTLTLPYITLTNALVDAGLAHGRALCEFLGFSRRRKEDALCAVVRSEKNKGDDLWVQDFGLQGVSPKSACSMGPEDPFDVSEALVHFLRAASKGVAHLTIQDETRADLLKLRIATVVIPKLVRRYVYEPLNLLALLDRRHHPCPVAEALGALNVPSDGSS